MADVSTDISGIGEADLCVHIRTVHIDLTAGIVNSIYDITDARLEDTVSRGVGDHHTAQLRAVLLGLLYQVVNVDITLRVARNGHDLHTGHCCRCGVGAVSRCGDKHNITIALTTRLVVGTDNHQAGVLASCTRVGLQRAGCEACDLRQVALELLDKGGVALTLLGGCEGVDILEAVERQGLHRNGGVELHCARAERDHRVRK